MNDYESIILSAMYFVTFLFGVIGNFICFLVFSRKNLNKISEGFYLQAMAINDSIILIQELRHFLREAFNINLKLLSDLWCKLFMYMTFSIKSVTSWITVYVLFDRFISLKFNRRFQFRNNFKFKMLVVFLIYLTNLVTYIPSCIFRRIKEQDEIYTTLQNQTKECIFYTNEFLIITMDLIQSAILPAILMIIISVFTVFLIINSRKRLNTQVSTRENCRVRKDFQFTLTLTFLILLFLAAILPFILEEYIPILYIEHRFLYFILDNTIYFNAALKVLIYYMTHKIFRSELLAMFGKKIKLPVISYTKTMNVNIV